MDSYTLVYLTCITNSLHRWYKQGLYPFSETNFQDFSRTQIDLISKYSKIQINPYTPKILNINSPYCLPYTIQGILGILVV